MYSKNKYLFFRKIPYLIYYQYIVIIASIEYLIAGNINL